MTRALLWLTCLSALVTMSEYQGGMYYSSAAHITTTASITTASAVVVPVNYKRKGLIIFNNSANSVYLTYGATSSSASCTRILATFTQYETYGPVSYTGVISGIRNAGSGTLTVTELE